MKTVSSELRTCTSHTLTAIVVFAGVLASLIAGTPAHAAFVVQFDPSQTTVQSNGSDQTFTIDLLVTHDGSADSSLFSGFTLRLANPGTDLMFSGGGELDFDFSQAPQVKLSNNTGLYSLGASSNDQNHDVGTGLTKRLMSVDFELDGSVDTGTFQLDLTLIDAKRGTANDGNLVDIAPSVSIMDGLFVVNGASAVPEPSSVLVLGGFSILWFRRRKRRRVSQQFS